MLTDRLPPLPNRLLAGVSGGADSVALLHLLLEAGVQVTAVHVNHGLRGAESDGDEAFVREVCAGWNVPLLVYRALPPDNPGEDWARQVRYGFYRQAAEATGVTAIALAHHRDDQAETLLMHLLRGCGLTGLTGMAADVHVQGLRILRPLLGFSRQELRELLTALGQPWREDASNADPRYLRNALRLEVLPRLEKLIPGASARMAETAALLREEDALLDGLAREFLNRWPGRCLPLKELRAQHRALARRILRAWWQREAPPRLERSLSAAQTERLLTLLETSASARCNLPGGWTAQAGWTHLHLLDGQQQSITETPLALCPLLCVEDAQGRKGDGVHAQAMPRRLLEGLIVRSRREGDWLRPFGSSGRQSLQDYFVNRRVDAPFRDQVPLVCRGSEVLLAGGVGAGDVPRAENEQDCVLICWREEFPWQAHGRGGKTK